MTVTGAAFLFCVEEHSLPLLYKEIRGRKNTLNQLDFVSSFKQANQARAALFPMYQIQHKKSWKHANHVITSPVNFIVNGDQSMSQKVASGSNLWVRSPDPSLLRSLAGRYSLPTAHWKDYLSQGCVRSISWCSSSHVHILVGQSPDLCEYHRLMWHVQARHFDVQANAQYWNTGLYELSCTATT